MERGWFDVENIAKTIGSTAPGLFGDERERETYVEQAEFARGRFGGSRVQINAPFQQVTMEIGH